MSDIRIRFRHLQCFLAIAQYKSVGAAAGALSVTQPALSKTLRELEAALSVRLFERTKTGMALTQFGNVFLHDAAASVTALRRGIENIRQVRKSDQEVRVGVLPTVTTWLMPRAVRQFKRQAPNATVRLVSGDHAQLLDLLRLGELDVVVGRLGRPERMIGLEFDELYVEPLTVVVRRGHPLSKMRRFKLPMVADYPCLLPHLGTIIRHEFDRLLLAHRVPVLRDVVETSSITFGRRYLRERDAVWFVAIGMVSEELKAGRAVELPVKTAALRGPVGMTVRPDIAQTVATVAMMDALRTVAGEPDSAAQ